MRSESQPAFSHSQGQFRPNDGVGGMYRVCAAHRDGLVGSKVYLLQGFVYCNGGVEWFVRTVQQLRRWQHRWI